MGTKAGPLTRAGAVGTKAGSLTRAGAVGTKAGPWTGALAVGKTQDLENMSRGTEPRAGARIQE